MNISLTFGPYAEVQEAHINIRRQASFLDNPSSIRMYCLLADQDENLGDDNTDSIMNRKRQLLTLLALALWPLL